MMEARPLTPKEEAYARSQWLDPTDLRLFATIDAERERADQLAKALERAAEQLAAAAVIVETRGVAS